MIDHALIKDPANAPNPQKPADVVLRRDPFTVIFPHGTAAPVPEGGDMTEDIRDDLGGKSRGHCVN